VEQNLVQQLSARVAQLESKARRDRTIALGAIAFLIATAQAPSPSAPVVVADGTGASATLTASGLVVRDKSDRRRLVVGLDSESRPALDLVDTSGSVRQTVYLDSSNNPALRQIDTAGKARNELSLAGSTQSPGFYQSDSTGKTRQLFSVSSDGQGLLQQIDSNDKTRVELSLYDSSQAPQFSMLDSAGKKRVAIFEGVSTAIGEVDVFGSNGNNRAALVGNDVGGFLVLKDANSTVRTALGLFSDGTFGFELRNSGGSSFWSTPKQ
jgi:hypothetical protein